MKANELRIGNWITFDGYECQITAIPEGNFYEDEKFSPIQITEEILIGFGFGKMDDNWYTHDDYNLECDERGFWLSFQTLQSSEIFNFVHQLQNLHHALTGQELTLK